MDVVYLVRPGNRNEELRYSLRSVAENLSHGKVWAAGHCPSWLAEVGHVAVRQDDHKHINTLANLTAALKDDRISDEFILMNDDFFILQPTAEVAALHRGSLDEWIAARVKSGGGMSRMGWTGRAIATRETLEMLGHDPAQLLSYELHVPLVIHRETMLAALEELRRIGRQKVEHWTKRTLYGNVAKIGGQLSADCKVADDEAWDFAGGAREVAQWRYLSTADASFNYGRVGRWLAARFPTACRYERHTKLGRRIIH